MPNYQPNRLYGIDIETHDPYLTDKGASWVYGDGEIIVTGLYNAQTMKKEALDGNGGQLVKNLLIDTKVTLIGTNLQYDLGWLCYEHKMKARDIKCNLIDISIVEQMIDEYQEYSLGALAWKYLKESKQDSKLKNICTYKGDFRRHLKKLWDEGYKDEIREYVISDADQPVRIWIKQKQIFPTDSLEALRINLHLIRVVLDMKQRGVRIDMEKRRRNYRSLKNIQDKLQADFIERYGKVNFNSPKQLAELFDKERVPYKHKIRIKCDNIYEERDKLKPHFDKIRIEKGQLLLYVPKQYAGRTNDEIKLMGYETTNNPTINKIAIDKLRKIYPVAKAIVDLKQVTSIIDKFMGPKFDRFIVKHSENDYRIHCDFNIIGARQTGRFSSANPNLQQVPSKTVLFKDTENEVKLYKLCREVIIPDEGYLWGKADYSGQENRLMAHYAKGEGANEIRQKYNENPDFDEHQWVADTAKALIGVELPRKTAKGIKFGLGYGQGLHGLCETNGWTREEGEKLLNAYNRTVPFVKATMDRVSQVITERGYIKTLAGRYCHLRNNNKRDAYKGFNKLIQGSAADMIKKAMVMLDESGLLNIFPLYLTVHDELDFGIKSDNIKMLSDLQAIMENTYPLLVPVRVDPELGKNWGHVKKIKIKRRKYVD